METSGGFFTGLQTDHNCLVSRLSRAFKLLPPRISTEKKQFCQLPLEGLRLQFKKTSLFASYSEHNSIDQEAVIKRLSYGNGEVGVVSQQLYSALNWVVELN